MDLLNNLLEFSRPSTLISFCQSPPSQVSPPQQTSLWLTAEQNMYNSSTAKKELDTSLQKRPSSKSVSKMTLFSLGSHLNSNIKPKQRLLHRFAHKINMKIRKHYYQFFVLLESNKTNSKSMKTEVPEKKVMNKQNLQQAISKLQQLQQIFFSKHFEHYLKKHSLRALRDVPKQKALLVIARIFNKKMRIKAYKQILAYSQYLSKQQIRLQIFSSSMQQIYSVLLRQHLTLSLLAIKNQKIKQKVAQMQILSQQPQPKVNLNEIDSLQMPKQRVDQLPNPSKRYSLAHNDIDSISVNAKLSQKYRQQYKVYQQLKKNRQSLQSSPLRNRQPINIKVRQAPFVNSLNGQLSFGKALKVKTNFQQCGLNLQVRGPQVMYQISKKIQANSISRNEIHDLNSRCIFVNSLFTNPNTLQKEDIVESKVQEYHFLTKKLYSQSSSSQLSLIDQFDQSSQIKGPIISNKSSRFGSEAVNFKNSLIYQREIGNPLYIQKNTTYQGQSNFNKTTKEMFSQNEIMRYSSGFQYEQGTRYSPQKDYPSIEQSSKQEKRPSFPKVTRNSKDLRGDMQLESGKISLSKVRTGGSTFERKEIKQLNDKNVKRNGASQMNSVRQSNNSNPAYFNYYKLNV